MEKRQCVVLGFLSALLMLSLNAWASPPIYVLSSTADLVWPSSVSYTATPLLSFNTVIFDVSGGPAIPKPAKVTVIHHASRLWASMDLVKKSWKQDLRSVAAVSSAKSFKDLGCKSLSVGRFSCMRTGLGTSGQSVVEQIIWNRNRDEILIRTESAGSPAETMNLAQSIQTHFKESR